MRSLTFGSFVYLALSVHGGLAAQTRTQEPFDRIEVQAGGTVLVEFGETPTAFLVDPDHNTRTLSVSARTLQVSCRRPCRDHGSNTVNVRVPSLSSILVSAGGTVKLRKGFAQAEALAVRVQAGGAIDASSLSARAVTVEISAGGRAMVSAREQLTSRIQAGGHVDYYGDPHLDTRTIAGGSVRRLGATAP